MAIAFDAASEGNRGTNDANSITFAHTCTGSDRILLVGALSNGAGGDIVNSVTYNAVACTKIASHNLTGDQWLSIWYLIAPATGANNIVVGVSGTSDGLYGMGSSYTGAKQSGQPDSSNTGTATGNLTLSTTVVANDSWLYSIARNATSGLPSAGTGTTIRGTGVAFNQGDSNAGVGTGSQSMGWNAAAGTTGGVIVSIAPAGGGGGATLGGFMNLLGVGN